MNQFNHLLKTKHSLISPELQIPFQPVKTYRSYIHHTLAASYTNAPIERINNKIKVMQRIASRYRSFYH